MKVCTNCGSEHGGKDGENLCPKCDAAEGNIQALRRLRNNARRRQKDAVLKSLGMTRVKGALEGVYWE